MAELAKERLEALELLRPDGARGARPARGLGGAQADDGHGAAHANGGKAVLGDRDTPSIIGGDVLRPVIPGAGRGQRYVSVVVPGHHRDHARRAQAPEPEGRGGELFFEREVHEIACDSDVVGILHLQILDQRIEDLAPENPVAPGLPRDPAPQAFVEQVARARHTNRWCVQIGDLSEREHVL